MLLSTLPVSLVVLLLASAEDAVAAPRPATSLHMNLKRKSIGQRSDEEKGLWAKGHRERMITKYGGKLAESSSVDRRASGSNLLINQNADSSFFGSVAIGTPAVSYDVILDTGSSDLWIADSSCTTNCENIATFTASDSSTFTNSSDTFSITYGSGEASGQLGKDVVQMAGFSVQDQTFASCDVVSQGLLNEPISGLLGLAFQSIASSRATPFWQSLVEGGAWDEPVMAFQLTRFGNDTQAQSLEFGGTFTMGATNSSLYTGDIDYNGVPDGQETYWLQTISSLSVGGNALTLDTTGEGSVAAIDTGTTLIGGPADQIAQFYSNIPNSQQGTGNYDGYYLFPCDSDVEATVSFGGTTWTISSADLKVQQVSNSMCMGAFFELSVGGSAPAWIFGDTFLKNVYSVFRYNPASVGFAQLSAEALAMNGDNDLELPSATVGSAAATVSATGTRGGGSSGSDGALQLAPGPFVFACVVAISGISLLW